MSKTDGGPAFPLVWPAHLPPRADGVVADGGMSLRDYFAGQALTGFLAHPDCFKYYDGADRALLAPAVASSCYELADALLKERGS